MNPITQKQLFHVSVLAILSAGVGLTTIGCGGGTEAKKDNEFFTSGDREADQRADQRMAKDQQLKDSKAPGAAPALKADAKLALYDRLGGDAGISGIVEDFVPRVLADPRVNFGRKDVKQGGFSFHRGRSMEWNESAENIAKFKLHLRQFLGLASGGPATYQGREMKSAHASMHISNPEFDAALGDLKASLDKLQVPVKEQKELLAVVESTRPQIVEER